VPAAYDHIGHGYAAIRRPDARLAALIHAALGDAVSVLNVGAGTGSYEPSDRLVVACEPSQVMLDQHPGRHRVRGTAEALPFRSGSFAASMAVMTVHHWRDPLAGLAEMRRVAPRQIVFTWDPDFRPELWIYDYLPELRQIDHDRFTPIATVAHALDARTVEPFPIAWDFADGYQPAFWRRPEAYLDPAVRAASSTFAVLPDSLINPAMERLRADLASGAWHKRYPHLARFEQMDYGYRLIHAGT
jgi:SAM-dependent methyltransferase